MAESHQISPNKDFSISLVTPWIKGNMYVDDQFFHVDVPNTVLFGLIPAGRQRDNSPLAGISNVYTSSQYKIGRIFLGGLIALAGIASFSSSAITALILILIGFAILGSGIQTVFAYERSGISKSISLPFFEANHSSELEEQLTAAIAAFQNDRNVRMNADRTINNANVNTDRMVEQMKKQNVDSKD